MFGRHLWAGYACNLTSTCSAQVADRLEKAVEACLDAGLRTGDIYREGDAGVSKVKCSEMGAELLKRV
jgi:3-isopropylmalate dehydrogenase